MDFLEGIKQLENPALLIKKHDDGTLESVFVTQSFADLMECTVEEALEITNGNGFILSTFPEDRIFVRKMLRKRISEDGTHDLVIRKNTAKGRSIWCNVHYAFIDDADEHYIYCTYFDVTVLKEYEQRLRSAYMSLGDTFYQASDRTLGMFRVNLSRDMIEDMQGRDLFGTDSAILPYSEVMGQRSVNYPIREEREKFQKQFDKDRLIENYLEGKPQVSGIFYSCRTDGRYCFVSITANITRHPMTGDVIAFISEEESNHEKVYETLLNQILVRQFDMVAYLTQGTYGVVIGDAAAIEEGSIFPLTRKGKYQSYLEAQVIPALHGTEEEKERQKRALMPKTIERELRKKNPYVVNIAVDIEKETYHKRFDFYMIDPEAKFYIILKTDTTDIQREQLRINEQLRLALEEAKQASVAKTVFLSQMSHEIRTPMNAIIGLDNIALQEPDLTPAVKEHLEKIGGSARHLLSLINDILDMSRIESGRMVLKKEEFSFRDFLDQVNTIVDGQCRDKGLHYECVIHGAVDEYYIGDDTKLRQVLINILGNSVKFTDEGGKVSLTVEKLASFENQTTMCFLLSDTGIGMDQEYLPKIFDAFSQEDATNTNKYGGSGLGLAITKNIVEMMNGVIRVTSKKGEGTTFTVEVTLQNSDRKGHTGEYDIRPQDMNVLIIDDDPVACRHTHIVLEEVGIRSETCLSGKEALEQIRLAHARREEYNLILVDLRMPEQDGVEVTREIRKVIGEETAIVILTAYSWTEVEEEAVNAGVDGFMSKPIFASNLLIEFQQALRKKKHNKAKEKKKAELNGKRILLAEDVMINAEIMKRLLSMKGIEVEHAENGQLAVDMFCDSPQDYYDAVLMDVRMPVLDGLGATEAIRKLDREDAQKVPIIAMTANAFDEDVQRSLQAGMNAHLAKPVEPEHLYQTLEELIQE
ncbi:MAG: response regulator [Lachnospiraceae bacterium]|nr:response regulator [Lachnospiraceae bacterium]